jgi:citrate/tricarballylate utilization protein
MYEQSNEKSILLDEAVRQYTICNACRHCEGFCAVWDVISLRTTIKEKDVKYFAYLCHDCRDCYYACPYSIPHEFSLNIPKINSKIRLDINKEMSIPKFLGKIYDKLNIITVSISILSFIFMITIIGLLRGINLLISPQPSFYTVIPSIYIQIGGIILGLYALTVLIYQGIVYWYEIGGDTINLLNLKSHVITLYQELSHKWFKGGGVGCDYPSYSGSYLRLFFHSLLVSGFILDFLSTVIAAFYEKILHIMPPYPFESPVVILGILGGLLLLLSSIGLLTLKRVSNKSLIDENMVQIDNWLIYLLALISISGFLLLIFRDTPFMGILLILHLSITIPLFLLAPYSKFSHFIYRYFATLKYNQEKTYFLKNRR